MEMMPFGNLDEWLLRVEIANLPMTGIGKLKSISECLKGVVM
jgi:hypothetical protein